MKLKSVEKRSRHSIQDLARPRKEIMKMDAWEWLIGKKVNYIWIQACHPRPSLWPMKDWLRKERIERNFTIYDPSLGITEIVKTDTWEWPTVKRINDKGNSRAPYIPPHAWIANWMITFACSKYHGNRSGQTLETSIKWSERKWN